MADSIHITDDLKQYLGENSSDLLTLAYQSMDVWNDVTVLPDIKNNVRLTSLTVDSIVKPYKATFEPTVEAIKFAPREIGVKVAKADLEVEPEKYRQTYLAKFMGKGVKTSPEDLPFAKEVWDAVFAAFGQDLNDSTAWAGVYNANGNAAVDVADGYGTILKQLIVAGDVAPEQIGALDSDNAYEQLKRLYRTIPNKWRKARWQLTAYMSVSSYEAYCDNLDKKNWNTGRGDDYLGPTFLRGTSGLLALKPATWMAETQRVFITPKMNILLPADAAQQDLAKMKIIDDVWFSKVGIAAALGFDFRYAGLIWCNELDEVEG